MAAAPHLHNYFTTVTAFADEMQAVTKAACALVAECESDDENIEEKMDAMREMDEKSKGQKDAMRAECEVLLRDSFALHNPSGSGAITGEEAAAFFEHLVHEEGDFIKAVSASAMANATALTDAEYAQMFRGVGDAEHTLEELIALVRAASVEQKQVYKDLCKECLDKATADYEANRAEKNSAAFKLMDLDGSGTIQLSEFLAAMDIFSDKGREFQKALGFDLDTCVCVWSGNTLMRLDAEYLGKTLA